METLGGFSTFSSASICLGAGDCFELLLDFADEALLDLAEDRADGVLVEAPDLSDGLSSNVPIFFSTIPIFACFFAN